MGPMKRKGVKWRDKGRGEWFYEFHPEMTRVA